MSAGPPRGSRVRAPERLTVSHDISEFYNGKHSSLDDWLRNRALIGEGLSARTYVVCEAGTRNRVVGYYAISTAMETPDKPTKLFGKNGSRFQPRSSDVACPSKYRCS